MTQFSLAGLLDAVTAHPDYRDFAARLAKATPGVPIGPIGLPDAVRPVVVAAVARALRVPVLWLTAQPDDARQIAEALRAFLPDPDRVQLMPAPDALPFERIPWDPVSREQRMATLSALYRWSGAPESQRPPVVVASLRGLLTCTLPRSALAADAVVLRVGAHVGVTQLLGQRPERHEADQVDRDYKPGFRLQAEHAVAATLGLPSALIPLDDAIPTVELIAAIFRTDGMTDTSS